MPDHRACLQAKIIAPPSFASTNEQRQSNYNQLHIAPHEAAGLFKTPVPMKAVKKMSEMD